MIEIDEIVSAHVSDIQPHGAFLDYESYRIFVRVVDITWEEGPLDISDYLTLGAACRVKILRKIDNDSFGAQFLGSMKDSESSDP